MFKEAEIIRIVREDILRILGEKRGSVSPDVIEKEVNISHKYFMRAIGELVKEQLIQGEGSSFKLIEKGQQSTKDILNKHLVCENYFKQSRSETKAHEMAHVLEHYVSHEVINNIKKISAFKKKGIPLTKFGFNKKGIITDIMFSDYGLFERIVSMGICLGEKIKVVYDIPDGIVVNVSGKNFAMGNEIAKEIEVLA